MFGFIPESLFTFIPESRSASSRNRVHLDPRTAFTFARNTQILRESEDTDAKDPNSERIDLQLTAAKNKKTETK